MPWDIKRAGDGGDDWLIMDGKRLRGSIHHAEPIFRVEIPPYYCNWCSPPPWRAPALPNT
jgi:hypothetical protein